MSVLTYQGCDHSGRQWSAPTTTQENLPPLKTQQSALYKRLIRMNYNA